MTKEQYLKIAAPFRENKKKAAGIRLANKAGTIACYAGYCLLLLSRIILLDVWFWRVLLVPAAAFAAVSLIRRRINAPRPYEVWEIEPLIGKDTRGRSFPSRHVFSASIIAMAVWSVSPAGGIALLAVSVLLAWCRVVSGVHFLKDVTAGLLAGAGIGLAGFLIL